MSEDNEGPTCINHEVEYSAISLNQPGQADLSCVTQYRAPDVHGLIHYAIS